MTPSAQFRPGAVWSLGEMLKITAETFMLSMEYFGRIGRNYAACDEESEPCDDHVKKALRQYIKELKPFVGGFRAPATTIALSFLSMGLKEEPCFKREVGRRAEQVFVRFQAEVGNQWLVIVDHLHSEYLDDDACPFGDEVRDTFPELAEDIDEAAKCLALSRHTACVFHLMRVMEKTVHLLAQKLRVSIDLRIASWNDITTTIGNKINAMPGKTANSRKNKRTYGEILTNLTAVRIAWRNEVMHPKKTYTEKEAARVFNHVEGFLTSLRPIL